MKRKQTLAILVAIPLFSLLAASCSSQKTNTLTRPADSQNDNSNASSRSVSDNTDNNSNADNGQVAGASSVQFGSKEIKINNLNLKVDVADNDAAREQGLSGREKLDDGTGMLFDFTNTDFHKPGFWMKDMNFKIDIIWVSNGKVVGVQANAPLPPEDGDLPVYYPPSDVTHVIEVPAGWSAKNNITIGSPVQI